MKIKLIFAAIAIVVVGTVTACVAAGPQKVVVGGKDLKPNTLLAPGPNQQAAPLVISEIKDNNIRKRLEQVFPGEETVYLTTIDFVIPEVIIPDNPSTEEDESVTMSRRPVILPVTAPATEDGKIDFGTWISQAAPALGTLLPVGALPWLSLAGYVLGSVFKKRSSQHWGDAASSLNPFVGGTVDFAGAKDSIQKAIGWEHTLQTPAELRAVADKLEAKAKADKALTAAKNA